MSIGRESDSFKPEETDIPKLVPHEAAKLYPGIRTRYQHERLDLKEAGKPVWILRSYGEPNPNEPWDTYDYYIDNFLMGTVKGSDELGYHIYITEEDEDDNVMPHKNTEPIDNLSEAMKKVRDTINGRIGPEIS